MTQTKYCSFCETISFDLRNNRLPFFRARVNKKRGNSLRSISKQSAFVAKTETHCCRGGNNRRPRLTVAGAETIGRRGDYWAPFGNNRQMCRKCVQNVPRAKKGATCSRPHLRPVVCKGQFCSGGQRLPVFPIGAKLEQAQSVSGGLQQGLLLTA